MSLGKKIGTQNNLVKSQNESKKFAEHKIVLENREKMSLSGVERVEIAVPTQFVCVAAGKKLQILGQNITVEHLDVECGCVALCGEFSALNYQGEKKSLLRRLFG